MTNEYWKTQTLKFMDLTAKLADNLVDCRRANAMYRLLALVGWVGFVSALLWS